MEHPVADRVVRQGAGRFRDELALDRQRPAAELLAAAVTWCFRVGILLRPQAVARAPPARRLVIRREGLHHFEARGKAGPPEAAPRFGDLDMRPRQLVE